ncbi:MAG: efflux RND transporter periplasmic adaptor subunit [Deltaproteobacteria bacterium]|nr:efflux RND transporter periplasmic adaptor subunit [Deltaproteobacteria bacterium]
MKGGRIVIAWVLWFGCKGGEHPIAPPPNLQSARASVAVRWVAALSPDDTSWLEFPALVRPDPQASAVLSTAYPSRVLAVFARAGDSVVAGQKLVAVRMPELVTAAGELIAATTRAKAYDKRKRQLDALAAEGLARLDEQSAVDVDVSEANAALQRARGILEGAGMRPSDAETIVSQQGRVILRSPVAGTLVAMNALVGAQVSTTGPPLAHVVGVAPGRIEVRLAMMPDKDTHFAFRDTAGATCAVALLSTAPDVDEADGSRLAWFKPTCLPLPVPGTRGVLSVRFPGQSGVVRVPARAVARTSKGDFVLKQRGSESEPIAVSIVLLTGGQALIRSTIAVGDSVASEIPPGWSPSP